MAAWIVILGFAISSSVDNFGAGLSYGIRNIKVGIHANTLIAVICFLFSFTSTILGNWLSLILPGILPILIAAVLLLFIGIRIIILAFPKGNTSPLPNTVHHHLDNILRHPEIADTDQSGEISLREALLLGIALSANALTNGLGAGLLDLNPFLLSLITAIGSFFSLWAGVSLGKAAATMQIASFNIGEFSTLVSGIILILIALKTLLC